MDKNCNEFEVYLFRQEFCPCCGSDAIDIEPDELVYGDGSHQSDALHCQCRDCDIEWYEPPPERD